MGHKPTTASLCVDYPPLRLHLHLRKGRLRELRIGRPDPDAPATTPSGFPAETESLLRALSRYFSGEPALFSFPLDLSAGTAFQREVWRILAGIPHGETRTYGWVAEQTGRPGASRAVGNAVGRNPVPIIIPCHRVLPASGDLGGFSSGVWVKKLLLDLEGVKP